MDSSGNVTKNVFNWAAGFGKGVENVSFVPDAAWRPFGCQAQGPGKFFQMIEDQDAIIMYPPSDFSLFVGDAIITTEAAPPDTTGGTFRGHFNPVTMAYETTVFDPTFGGAINEGARFVDCDVVTPTPTPTSTLTNPRRRLRRRLRRRIRRLLHQLLRRRIRRRRYYVYADFYANVYANTNTNTGGDGASMPGRKLRRRSKIRFRCGRHLDRIQPVPGAQRQQLRHQRRRLGFKRALVRRPDRQ